MNKSKSISYENGTAIKNNSELNSIARVLGTKFN